MVWDTWNGVPTYELYQLPRSAAKLRPVTMVERVDSEYELELYGRRVV